MKFFIVLSVALVASVHAIPLGGLVNTGASAVSRSEDGLGNYAFGYNEDHATGGTFRKEEGGHGVKVGSYGLRDADGRVRTVNYVADALGFRASVSTNEPGVDPKQDPAAINLNNGLHGGLVPAPLAPAPLLAAAPLGLGHGAELGYGGPIGAAPLLAAGPLGLGHGAELGYGAPLAPIASSYGWNTQHVSAGPLLAAPAQLGLGHGAALGGYGGHY